MKIAYLTKAHGDFLPGWVDRDSYPDIPDECFDPTRDHDNDEQWRNVVAYYLGTRRTDYMTPVEAMAEIQRRTRADAAFAAGRTGSQVPLYDFLFELTTALGLSMYAETEEILSRVRELRK